MKKKFRILISFESKYTCTFQFFLLKNGYIVQKINLAKYFFKYMYMNFHGILRPGTKRVLSDCIFILFLDIFVALLTPSNLQINLHDIYTYIYSMKMQRRPLKSIIFCTNLKKISKSKNRTYALANPICWNTSKNPVY